MVDFIFIDEGILPPQKVAAYNEIVSFSNKEAKIFNNRSFFLNEKEIKGVFAQKNFDEKNFEMNLKLYSEAGDNFDVYQSVFVPFEFVVCEEKVREFARGVVNKPLFSLYKHNFSQTPTFSIEKPQLSDDTEYQNYLREFVNSTKFAEKEPVFVEIFGVFVSEKMEVKSVRANYKGCEIDVFKEKTGKNVVGLWVMGKNLRFEGDLNVYREIFNNLHPSFPELKRHLTTKDITEELRSEINYNNLLRPLPSGWELEGPVVVDEKGEIHHEHPNLEQFINEYLEEKNREIDVENKGIEEEINKLRVENVKLD